VHAFTAILQCQQVHYPSYTLYDDTKFAALLIIDLACSAVGGQDCQNNIFSLEGTLTNIKVYALSTVGTTNMVTQNGNTLAVRSDNVGSFQDTIALFQLAAGTGPNPTTSSTTRASTTLSTRTTTSATAGPTPSGWRYLGCYTDNVGGRALPVGTQVPGGAGAMTVEACTTACRAGGYVLAGLEYAGECCKCFYRQFVSLPEGC
jgi:glucan 1,3-beta-glucosidase